MPRNYQRTTNRQSWSKESMQQAISAWKENKMGWELAAKTFGVPQATLRRHALNTNKTLESSSKGLGRFKATFPPEIERELVDHIKFLETRLFGLTRTAIQELAFELAEKNGFDHVFNKDKKRAGQEWLESFLKRNPDISLRTPEPTSAARAQAFNRPQVARFFQIYEEFLNTHKLEPQRVYNMDESGLTTVQKPQKILATKGRKQIGCLTSAERGSNVTVVCCTNAIGSFIPPCMIFPRKNMKNELIDEAPTGTLGLAQESGWMNTDVFVKWLKHFQLHTKASKEDPVLLICDGHASHKTIEALTYAKENGINMLCLPPHCTHRMQPLDVSIYGPLKTFYNQEISKWLKNHPGRVVTHLQIGGLFAQAYGKAATVQNASNGFKSTGLWPINPDIFPDYMFEPAETTNIPLDQVNVADTQPEPAYARLSPVENENPTPTQADLDNTNVSTLDPLETQNTTRQMNAIPEDEERPLTTDVGVTFSEDLVTNAQESLTAESSITTHDDGAEPGSSKSLEFPIAIISPAPQGQFIRGQGKRKVNPAKGHWLLTSTPNMEEVIEKNRSKDPPAKMKRQVKKVLFEDGKSNSNKKFTVKSTVLEAPKKRQMPKRQRRTAQTIDSSSDTEDIAAENEDDEDCPCIYCNDLYSRSKPGESWLRCMSCFRWAHASCADVSRKTKRFICELCS